MWRALFFLAGLFCILQGALVLAVSEVTLHDWATERLSESDLVVSSRVVLPVWLAPSLFSTGMVTLVYAIALPKKKNDD